MIPVWIQVNISSIRSSVPGTGLTIGRGDVKGWQVCKNLSGAVSYRRCFLWRCQRCRMKMCRLREGFFLMTDHRGREYGNSTIPFYDGQLYQCCQTRRCLLVLLCSTYIIPDASGADMLIHSNFEESRSLWADHDRLRWHDYWLARHPTTKAIWGFLLNTPTLPPILEGAVNMEPSPARDQASPQIKTVSPEGVIWLSCLIQPLGVFMEKRWRLQICIWLATTQPTVLWWWYMW